MLNDEKSMLLTNLLQGNPNKHHHNFLLEQISPLFFPNIVEVASGKRRKWKERQNLKVVKKDHCWQPIYCNHRLQKCDCNRTFKTTEGHFKHLNLS